MESIPAGRRRAAALGCGLAVLVLVAGGCRSADPVRWSPASGVPPPVEVLLPVEGRPQERSLSCESRSACDLLGWHGIRVEEATFLAGLPRSDNPDEGFVGPVDDPGEGLPPRGYGVHEEPVARRLRAHGLDARPVRGRDLGWIRSEVAQGRPVMVWATARLDAPAPVTLVDARGRSFQAVRGEHTFLVVGYGGGDLRLLDAATGSVRRVPASRFLASWSVLGRRAIEARGARSGSGAGGMSPAARCFRK